MSSEILRDEARTAAVRLDRDRWQPCPDCGPENKIWKFCPFCGRPKTEEAWRELERRIVGNDGKANC